jgi:hypothetical protein
MPFLVTPADRASFNRCRRQWDFGAGTRQNLEPLQSAAAPDLDRALRDALAVYYYPGMWDWDRQVTLPLVVQGLERALARQQQRSGDSADARRWQHQLEAGRGMLARYFAWAPTVDTFAPVLVEADYEVNVLDPARPSDGLVTAAGEAIRYRGRIDMMAVDRRDAYWIVRHRLVHGDWPPTGQLAADEETLAACWAWEQFYIGMAITGIVYNELRRPVRSTGEPAGGQPQSAARRWRLRRPREAAAPPAVRQHEPSGGGRSIPQHRRMYAQAREPRRLEPVEQRAGDGFRRTWLRRAPADIAGAGRRLGADVAGMIRRNPDVSPNPSDDHCPACPYLDPCTALSAGTDAGPILLSGYRRRPPEGPEEGRLGGGAWGMGRGAAPPRFRGSQGSQGS